MADAKINTIIRKLEQFKPGLYDVDRDEKIDFFGAIVRAIEELEQLIEKKEG